MTTLKNISEIVNLSGTTLGMDARNTTLNYCDLSSRLPSLGTLTGRPENRLRNCPPDIYLFLQILFVYALRFSELYDATIKDVLPGDRVFIHGKKRSSSTIIYINGINALFENYNSEINAKLFGDCNYARVYRYCRKIGINHSYHTKYNCVVTHTGRKKLDSITNGSLTDTQLSDCLRHKNKSNNSFYRDKGIKKNG